MRGTLRLRRRRPTATPATPIRGFTPPLSWGHVLAEVLAVDHDRTPHEDRSRSPPTRSTPTDQPGPNSPHPVSPTSENRAPPTGRTHRPLGAAVQRRATAHGPRRPRPHAPRGLLPPQPRPREAVTRSRDVDAAGRRDGRAAGDVLARRAPSAVPRAHGGRDAPVRRQPARRARRGGRPAGRDTVGPGCHRHGALVRRAPRRRPARGRGRAGRHGRRAHGRGRHRGAGCPRALRGLGAAGEGPGARGAPGVVDERRAAPRRARGAGARRRPRLDRGAQREVARARHRRRPALRRALPGRRVPAAARRRRPPPAAAASRSARSR